MAINHNERWIRLTATELRILQILVKNEYNSSENGLDPDYTFDLETLHGKLIEGGM